MNRPTNRSNSTGAEALVRLTEYLTATGWNRKDHTWRGATVWTHATGQVVSIPESAEHDVELRILDAVEGIARAEGRSPEHIATAAGVEIAI